jgi:hypothetical protein
MEVDRVATKLTKLADILKLDVRDTANIGVVTRRMDQDMSAIFVFH